MNMTQRKATRRGWEGPYRYRLPKTAEHSAVLNGWIVTRGRKWLRFYSMRDGFLRVKLSEEKYMVLLQPSAAELIG